MADSLSISRACDTQEVLSVEQAQAHVVRQALRPSAVGTVGLELEWHLIDAARPGRRPSWGQVQALVRSLPPLPEGSRVSVEPGGQLELSTVPAPGVAAAVTALSEDLAALVPCLGEPGLVAVPGGADPHRPPARISPQPRYAAMEAHFDAVGCGAAGRAMMCSTASLQINVEAGPERGWASRLELVHALGPVLVALSACSPTLAGATSGWRSMRQQAWAGLDGRRCGPVPVGGSPAEAWAGYALRAPVLLVRDATTGRAEPVRAAVPFRAWAAGQARLGGRRPTVADLDYHLTTLWPPVRSRGFLEIRCLDAAPAPWWRGLAALAVTLLDDPSASDRAAAAVEPVRNAWAVAARDGLGHPELRRAARECVDAAARRCPGGLRSEVEGFAELVERGGWSGEPFVPTQPADSPLRAGAARA